MALRTTTTGIAELLSEEQARTVIVQLALLDGAAGRDRTLINGQLVLVLRSPEKAGEGGALRGRDARLSGLFQVGVVRSTQDGPSLEVSVATWGAQDGAVRRATAPRSETWGLQSSLGTPVTLAELLHRGDRARGHQAGNVLMTVGRVMVLTSALAVAAGIWGLLSLETVWVFVGSAGIGLGGVLLGLGLALILRAHQYGPLLAAGALMTPQDPRSSPDLRLRRLMQLQARRLG